MPKIFLLRHAFAEQQATLEDASKFRTRYREEVSIEYRPITRYHAPAVVRRLV
jgi:hypothetical protein